MNVTNLPATASGTGARLALLGGPRAVRCPCPPDFNVWPILSGEEEQAVIEVLRARKMSNWNITAELEKEYAAWEGSRYALGCNNGTAAIHCALYGLGVGRGDEVITPTWTFWASHTQVLSLGATPVFCDIDPQTLCLDPADVERRITPRTKAIIAVHMAGYAADMDALMDISARTGVRILEDYSHAHASTWKGRKVGSIGHVGAASIMTGKPLATGEGGMMNTNDRDIFERAVMFGHYERQKTLVTHPDYLRLSGLPWGGYKYRMHQMTSAVARVQLRHYDEYRAPGVKAMERFFTRVCAVPGVHGNFPLHDPDVTVGASYFQMLILDQAIVDRVPVAVICEALTAEGCPDVLPGGYFCHHLHPFWNECDVYGDGKPARLAFSESDVRRGRGDCPVAEGIVERLIRLPRMIRYDEAYVDDLANAFVKVLTNLAPLEGMTSDRKLERSTTLG